MVWTTTRRLIYRSARFPCLTRRMRQYAASLGALAGDPDGSRGVDNGAPRGEAEVRLKTPIRLLGLRAAGPQQAARSVEANHDPA
jgi:hypothetical protein